jgi:hypothetical protein
MGIAPTFSGDLIPGAWWCDDAFIIANNPKALAALEMLSRRT